MKVNFKSVSSVLQARYQECLLAQKIRSSIQSRFKNGICERGLGISNKYILLAGTCFRNWLILVKYDILIWLFILTKLFYYLLYKSYVFMHSVFGSATGFFKYIADVVNFQELHLLNRKYFKKASPKTLSWNGEPGTS